MPHLKSAYGKYQADRDVAFLLVSIDEDPKRLDRYLNEMKFPFPVMRMKPDEAQRVMRFDNLPQTYYVDRGGVVRYHAAGLESHGDSPSRVGWYIDRLKGR